MPKQKQRREKPVGKTPKASLQILIWLDRDYRALAALAAFNQTTMESCAARILSEVLCDRGKEMEFHGLMCV